jgi:imidazolonepropionase-like amidohydrolase
MATVQGAMDIGLGDKTGSLTPGKFAYIVAIAAEEFSYLPPQQRRRHERPGHRSQYRAARARRGQAM